ncbi:hypothetical protein [Saccharopolyspora sp. NPDC049357]|uniref:hypothetical protein n=1 Tax=Saccharopolyspora sp. NPDC049357 TaxID=3154507 RepID=UPI0034156CB0
MNQVMVAVEGISDEGAVRSILREFNLTVHLTLGRNGKAALLSKISAYNDSAKYMPWFVLVDLDSPDTCIVEKLRQWMPNPSEYMLFRVAVSELEAWLLADREAIAQFLGVSVDRVPRNPDSLKDPKQEIINLARRSRRREIREGLVPRQGSGVAIGPTYASDIRNFGESMWRPKVAAEESPSLSRCLRRVEELANKLYKNTDALKDHLRET